MNRQRDEPATFVSKYHTLTHPPQRVSPGFTSPHSVRLVGSMSSVSVALNVSAHDRNVACGAKGGLPGLLQSVAVNSLNCDTITNLGRGSAMAARICINSVEPCRKRPFLLHFPTRTYSHPQPVWSNNRSHQKPAWQIKFAGILRTWCCGWDSGASQPPGNVQFPAPPGVRKKAGLTVTDSMLLPSAAVERTGVAEPSVLVTKQLVLSFRSDGKSFAKTDSGQTQGQL